MLGRPEGAYPWNEPGGYDYAAFLRQRQRESTPMIWSALYQQRPAPEQGDFFRSDWLHTYDRLPPKNALRVYGASDFAVTMADGDWTVHLVVGLDPDGRMYVLDVWREQTSSDQWVESFCDLVTAIFF